jgi:hypothetical protein
MIANYDRVTFIEQATAISIYYKAESFIVQVMVIGQNGG